jgi:hypothetical protein
VLDGYSKSGEEVITESDDDYDSQDFLGEEGEEEEDEDSEGAAMNAKWYKEKLGSDYDSEEGEEEVDEEYGDCEGSDKEGGAVKRAKKDE